MSIAMATIVLVSLCAVCASTSVSAAPSSNANVQTSEALVGAPIVGAPAVCSQNAYSLDLFVKGTDGALWYRHYSVTENFWGAWKPLGGQLTSDPAATSWSDGRIDVFVRGGDGALWQRWTWDGGATWTPWGSLGGQLAPNTGPGVSSHSYGIWSGGRNEEVDVLNVFVIGSGHALWQIWGAWSTVSGWSGWSNWKSLGGYATSSPASIEDILHTDVFVRGGDGALWQREQSSAWGAWTSLGGQIAPGTAPAAAVLYDIPSSPKFVFIDGMDSALWYRYGTGGTPSSWSGWSNWKSLGPYLTSSPAATSRGKQVDSGYVHVLVRGGDYNLWWKAWVFSTSTWYDWEYCSAGPP
jgi:hypothetical protein